MEPQSLIACIVQAADTISAARPGARRETLDAYIKRLQKLEEVSSGFTGVEKAFAIQAGREVRVMVTPEAVSEDQMVLLAHDIAKRLKMEKFWPLFEDYWRVRNLRTYNSMFSTTAKSVTFWKRLNKIKEIDELRKEEILKAIETISPQLLEDATDYAFRQMQIRALAEDKYTGFSVAKK